MKTNFLVRYEYVGDLAARKEELCSEVTVFGNGEKCAAVGRQMREAVSVERTTEKRVDHLANFSLLSSPQRKIRHVVAI